MDAYPFIWVQDPRKNVDVSDKGSIGLNVCSAVCRCRSGDMALGQYGRSTEAVDFIPQFSRAFECHDFSFFENKVFTGGGITPAALAFGFHTKLAES
jgi:hypothetical protein